MKSKQSKTKQITKDQSTHLKKGSKKQRQAASKKPLTNKQGDPLIQNLTDFITSIKNTYSSRPIYTGGRILIMKNNIYATCNDKICIYKNPESVQTQQNTIKNEEEKSDYQWIAHKNQEIVNFSVCPQQKYIVTFTKNSLLRVLLLENKKIIHTLKINGVFANDIAFSSDGKYIACAFGNQVQIFTFESMKRTHNYYPSGNNNKFVITRLQWHPNPDLLQIISADMQHTITLFDYILNKVIATSQVNEGGSDFCISEDGKMILSINDLQVRVYELKGLKLKYRIPTQQYMECIFAIGSHVYFGGQNTGVMSLNYLKQQNMQIKHHQGCTDNGVSKIMGYTQAGNKSLFVLSHEQNITTIKIEQGNNLKPQGIIVGYNDQIIDIKCSKNQQSEKYFIMVTNSNNVKVMNSKNHKLQYLIKGHTNTVLCAEYYHPYIATGGKDNEMKLWQINQDKKCVQLLGNYHGHSGDIVSICMLAKKYQLATISDDLTLKIWPMISPLIEQANNTIQIRSSLHTVPAHTKSINNIKVCPKQEFIATCSQDKSIKIWDLTLNVHMVLNGHRKGVWDIAFHPVEKLLISVGGEGMLKGWNLLTGQNIWSMGQGDPLLRCSWIYYNQVVTGSLEGIVKIWDIRKMTSLTYDKHQGKIWALDVCKHIGKSRIYTGGTDSVYHVWDDNTDSMKSNIMHKNQLEEQQRIFYNQHMQNKNYIDAALVAFKGGYKKLFISVLQKMSCPFSAERSVTFAQDQKLIFNDQNQQQQPETTIDQEQWKKLVCQLKDIDITRLLNFLQVMNSTVRHYKIANKILKQLLKNLSLTEFMQLNRTYFGDTNQNDQTIDLDEGTVQKKSALQKWFQNMLTYESKHNSRVNRYIRSTYWIEQLNKIENPYLN